MLTQERADLLSGILNSDQKRAEEILAMDPADALAQINSQGADFTLEEIKEFGQALKLANTDNDVLDIDALDAVAGGVIVLAPIGIKVVGIVGKSLTW